MTLRDRYPSFFRSDDIDLETVSSGDVILVLDSSVWLKFYELAPESEKEFLSALEDIKDGVWMPHQVAVEFLGNRSKAILAQLKTHEEAKKQVRNLVNKVKEIIQRTEHPHLAEDDASDLFLASENLVGIIEEKGETAAERFEDFEKDDPILSRIESVVEGRIMPEPDAALLYQRIQEARIRFDAHIPPGYADAKKAGFQFGDYFIWAECLAFAKNKGKPMIFATADYKEDWWHTTKGRKEPRPELGAEFRASTGRPIRLLTAKEFFDGLASLAAGKVTAESKEDARRLTEEGSSSVMDILSGLEPLGLSTEDFARVQSVHEAIASMPDFRKSILSNIQVPNLSLLDPAVMEALSVWHRPAQQRMNRDQLEEKRTSEDARDADHHNSSSETDEEQ